MNSEIEIAHLKKNIGRKLILDDISFSIDRGETVGLIGRNGAGKTSILKCLVGLWRFDSGKIFVKGVDITKHKKSLAKVSALIEYPTLFAHMTLKENIEYFKILSSCTTEQAVSELLLILNLQCELDKKISAFSSGMKQKACLLIALMRKPDVLILDEPTSMLDPITAAEIREFIKKIRNKDIAIIISSHNINELEGLCDRAIVIENGKISRSIDLSKTTHRYAIEFVNEDELNRITKLATRYDFFCQNNGIILFGDANILKQFLIDMSPNLIDIKNVSVLESEYISEETNVHKIFKV